MGSARKRRRGGKNDVDDDGDDGGVQALENAKRRKKDVGVLKTLRG